MAAAEGGGDAADVWRRYDDAEVRLSAALSERMLDLAGLRAGMRVLDLATGRGEPAVRAAHRVAPDGVVVGVDVSAAMLAMARERAAHEGAANLSLHEANVETLEGVDPGPFDAVLARWGLMYFEKPVLALAAARRRLAPGGVLVAGVWAEPEKVGYVTWPRRLLEAITPLPPIDRDHPGPFYYASEERLRRDLATAGFAVTHVEEFATSVMEARTTDDLIHWTRSFGMNRLLKDLPPAVQRDWEFAVAEHAPELRTADGRYRLGGVTRLVRANLLHSESLRR